MSWPRAIVGVGRNCYEADVLGVKDGYSGLMRTARRLKSSQVTLASFKGKIDNYRDFSTIAEDLRMTELGPSLKIKEKRLFFRRAMPCSVLQFTLRTPPWVSPIPRCYRPRSSSLAVEITSIG